MSSEEFIEIKGPFTKFPSIGECIYCGARNVSLTKEHILPYAIAGNSVIFEGASCTKCADFFTREFEQQVLSKMLYPIRFKIGAPTRDKKSRQHEHKLLFGKDIKETPCITKEILLDRSEYPLFFVSPRLKLPKIITNTPSLPGEPIEAWANIKADEIKQLCKKHGQCRVYLETIHPLKFARFLAKVAYSYAVAKFGKNYFKDLISPLLHGKTELFTDLIGGEYEIEPVPAAKPMESLALHEISEISFDANHQQYLAIRIRLFSIWETPTYYVVVGTAPDQKT